MCASGAKYGIMTAHFYWIGAVPAMLFVGVFMMPFYYGSRARSVPEYLKLRFDEKTRALNAITFAVMTVFSSGISMYALGPAVRAGAALELHRFGAALGRDRSGLHVSGRPDQRDLQRGPAIFPDRAGLRAARHSRPCTKAGGWSGMASRFPAVMTHTWTYVGRASENPMGVEAFGLVAGLGLRAVVRLLVHGFSGGPARHGRRLDVGRAAHAADRGVSENGDAVHRDRARHRGAGAVAHGAGLCDSRSKPGGGLDYDQTLTTLMAQFYPSGMLGVGLTALMASFMSGMAGNVTAFNTVWTYDLYQGHIRKHAPDSHYLMGGRA